MYRKTIAAIALAFLVVDEASASSAESLPLGDLEGGNHYSYPWDVSADGRVVVGQSVASNGYEAFRWEDGAMIGLGVPDGPASSSARGVSGDGAVVVGNDQVGNYSEAFRWTEAGGKVYIGHLDELQPATHAYAVSDDGTVIVGRGEVSEGAEAFI